MKYFTKYLPVEGEIKEGEICFVDDGEGNTGYLPYKSIYSSEGGIVKKVKLFLCSRDIQIGDKVFLENGYNYFSRVTDKIGNSDRDIILETMPKQRENGTLDYREMVKVIGEISPDAIWVKDGDEFDRNDFEMRWTNSKGENSLTMSDIDTGEIPPRLVAYFKCPTCKQYH